MRPVNAIRDGTLVIYRGALGDLLGAVPSLRALKEAYPDGALTLLAQPAAGALLQRCGVVDAALDVNAAEWLPLFTGTKASARFRRRMACIARCVAWINDPDDAVRHALHSWGVDELEIGPPFGPPHGIPHARYLAGVLWYFGVDVEDYTPVLTPHPHDVEKAADWIGNWHSASEHPLLALHPGSGSPAKNWPPAAFRAVVQEFRRTRGGRVVLCLGPAETERGPGCAAWEDVSDAVVECAPLAELGALVSLCSVYLGNDAGTTHLAAAMGTPTIALFGGASDAAVWAPVGERVQVVPVTCGPDADPHADEIAAVSAAVTRALESGGYNSPREEDRTKA